MTDHPSPEQIAARIAGELESITEACPSNPSDPWFCNLCPDCLTKLEKAIAAALAAKDAEIARLTTERDEYRTLAKIGAWHNDCRPNRHKAATEIEKGQVRINQFADALTQARARVAQLEQALTGLRDYFAYGQRAHTGMSVVATPRCSPSAWKEIRSRVDTALRATSPEEP